MPLPKPRKGEKQDAFISRCMGNDLMNKEYPDNKQRAAVCYSQWRAKMKNQQYNVLTTNNYTIRTETHQGKKHLVIPVVMLVEGVHSGSAGPLLHTQDEFSKFPAAWNGIPVLIGHPEEGGHPISANSPKVIDQSVVGRVYNSKAEDGKLKGEVWAEVDKLKQLSPLAYAYIMQQKPLDVSVGVFSDDEPSPGEWNGENYIAIARNYRPDHLALLPEVAGACSWQDGCGVRVNSEGLLEAINLIRDKLYSLDNDTDSHYLEEVYDDGTFIYRKETNGKEKYYKRTYGIKDGEVQFGNDGEEVVKEIKYKKVVTMKRTKNPKNNTGGNTMNDKIKELLTIAPSVYTEDDKEWLEKLEEGQVDKLIACAKTNAETTTAKEAAEADKAKAEEKITALESEIAELKKGAPQVNEEAAMKILKEKVSDIKTFEELLPDELKKQFNYGQKLYTAHRQELIQHILDNQADEVWDEESLKKKDDDDLQKTADSIKKPVSYEGAAGGFSTNADEEILLPPGVEAEKK